MAAREKWLLGGMLVILSLFVSSTFGTWAATCGMAFLAFVVVRLRRDRDAGRDRGHPRETESVTPTWLIFGLKSLAIVIIAAVMAAWRVGAQQSESINPIYVGIDASAHAAVAISFFLWTLRPNRGHVSMLLLGLMVVLLCVAAGGTSQTLTAQTAVALCACIGFVIASQIIVGRPLHSRRHVATHPGQGRQRRIPVATLFSLLTLSLILMATSAVAKVTSDVLPGVKSNLHEQLKQTFDAVSDELLIGGTRYVQGSRLGSVRKHIMADPQSVALRIHADRAPGYLRGTVFDFYRNRRWYRGTNRNLPNWFKSPSLEDRNVEPSGEARVRLQSATRRPLTRFLIGESANEQNVSLEILNDPLKGTTVFTPLATQWIEASSGELLVTHHDIVRVGVDVTQPYAAVVAATSPRDPLDADRLKVLRDVPRNGTADVVSRMAGSICASQSTAQGKANALAEFFQSEFTYSLTITKPPANVDPIVHFLEEKHPAHCEYFATATALMLRSVGVPTRYVTGYVSTEFSEESSYWLARNRDAHAWVEAYDDRTQKWFPVESTPGRRYRTVSPLLSDQSDDDYGADSNAAGLDDDDTMLGRAWSWITSMRATDSLIVVFRFAQLPLFCVLVFLLWHRFWRSNGGDGDATDVLSRRMLRQVDRLARRRNLIREPHETIHQFAQRVQQHQDGTAAGDKQLDEIAGWYRQYADSRYRGQVPTAFPGLKKRIEMRQFSNVGTAHGQA